MFSLETVAKFSLNLPAHMSSAAAVTDASFEQDVLQSDVPVLVDFWAPWCGPCRMIAPLIDQLAEEYEGKLKAVRAAIPRSPRRASPRFPRVSSPSPDSNGLSSDQRRPVNPWAACEPELPPRRSRLARACQQKPPVVGRIGSERGRRG